MNMEMLQLPGVVLVACFIMSCTPDPPPKPAWYPLAPCGNCYQGEGVASEYAVARKRALAALCEDIAVVVESQSVDRRTFLLKESSAGGRQASLRELVELVGRTRARCVLPGLPIVEKREDVGDRSFVVLRLDVGAWKKFMDSRATFVRVEVQGAAGNGGGLHTLLADYLRSKGYPVATVEERANMAAVVRFSASVEKTPDDFQGLRVGTASLSYSLIRLTGGDEVESVHLPDITARAFKQSNVEKKLEEAAVQKLREKLGL